MGEIQSVRRGSDTLRVRIRPGARSADLSAGASLAVNGVCLTVVERDAGELAFDLGPETIRCTALSDLRSGDRVNLERPLRIGDELGGHFVLGHVDGVGTIAEVVRLGDTARLRVSLPRLELASLVIRKGSVAVDGVSLTVADLDDTGFDVMIVPHTLAVTTLGHAVVGRRVNLELDVIGKYVVRALSLREAL